MRKPGGYFRIPNDVLRRHGRALGPYCIAVYAVLALHADRDGIAWPSQTTIAKMVGISRPTVATSLDLLVGFGLVRIVRKGARGRSTRYQLVDVIYGERCQPDSHFDVNRVDTNQTHKPERKTRARAPPHRDPIDATR